MASSPAMGTVEEVQAAFSAPSPQLPGAFVEVNEGFTLISGYLVFFMHCGFAMLSIGCVRSRFAKHIAILILLDACSSALGWYILGFAFAFGDDPDANGILAGNPFVGSTYFGLHELPPTQYYLWFFEWTFAATACTIVSGAIAERARFEAYVLYSFWMSSWVYPVVVHSVWAPRGWASMFRNNVHSHNYLFGSGTIDFAGSGAVHMVGGMAALTGCFVLRPRIGRFLPDGTVVQMAGHNSSLFVLGVLILWFGWYGFNPGSELAIVTTMPGATFSVASAVSNAAVTTTLCPATAALTGLAIKAALLGMQTKHLTWDIMTMGNSVLGGLVAITSGCAVIPAWGAVVVGAVAGIVYPLASIAMARLRLDDPLDAIAVHFFCGGVGVAAPGFLAGRKQVLAAYGPNAFTGGDREYGCFLGGSGRLLAAQLVYMFWVAGWVAVMMLPFWVLLRLTGLFRVSADHETIGLDASHHGGSAYPEELVAEMHGSPGGAKPAVDLHNLEQQVALLRRKLEGRDELAAAGGARVNEGTRI